jgi:hypothetical protein
MKQAFYDIRLTNVLSRVSRDNLQGQRSYRVELERIASIFREWAIARALFTQVRWGHNLTLSYCTQSSWCDMNKWSNKTKSLQRRTSRVHGHEWWMNELSILLYPWWSPLPTIRWLMFCALFRVFSSHSSFVVAFSHHLHIIFIDICDHYLFSQADVCLVLVQLSYITLISDNHCPSHHSIKIPARAVTAHSTLLLLLLCNSTHDSIQFDY